MVKSLTLHILVAYDFILFLTSLNLNNVLCVPKITKNLISISKLRSNNNIIIEFSSNLCFVKDKMEGILIAHGIAKGGLNKLLSQDDSDIVFKSESLSLKPNSMLSVLQNKGFVNSLQKSNSLMSVSPASFHSNNLELSNSNTESFLTSIQLLHNRFGHPNKHALQTIIKKLYLHHISNQSL